MRAKTIFYLLVIFMLIYDPAFGQQIPVTPDSSKLYANIQSYSKRNKFTSLMYGMIFRPVGIIAPKKKIKKKINTKLLQKPYSAFEGKIIRNISIETLDPFGYSLANPLGAEGNFF